MNPLYYASVGCSVGSVVTLVRCLRCAFHGLRPLFLSPMLTLKPLIGASWRGPVKALKGLQRKTGIVCGEACSWTVFFPKVRGDTKARWFSWWKFDLWQRAVGTWILSPGWSCFSFFLPCFSHLPLQFQILNFSRLRPWKKKMRFGIDAGWA
jgi:hypothetical protein